VVTTNWDFAAGELLVPDEHKTEFEPSIDYLHGTYSIGLYLPAEVIDEPYRGIDNRSEFLTSAISTVHCLRDASLLILYGLSLSPLDAELGFLLQWSAKLRVSPFREVVVVDPRPADVIANLRVHLGTQRYLALHPDHLPDLRLSTEW
jgi:hypothetical protein